VEKTKTQNTRKRKNTSLISAIIIFLLATGFQQAKEYYSAALGPMNEENPSTINLVIPPATSTADIGNILYEQGLIKHPLIFKHRVKKRSLDSQLKAGQYTLATDMDLNTIIDKLTKGVKDLNTIRFTIPEGYEILQVAEKLEKEAIVNKDRFLELAGHKSNFQDKYGFLKELDDQSLEGFLFPSTYEIFLGSKEEDIIEKMLDQFEKIYDKEIKDQLDKINLDLNEAITLASIIEREGKLDKERPLMSAVFHNRLKKGMALQSCATVQYILGERKENLSNEDTSIQSPFNTYIHTGLPPAPIASPGEASIIAALYPEDVDYLFFVLTGDDGTHTFSVTYEDHLRAKPKK